MQNQPAVVRGAVSHWPAVGKWTPAYLRQVIGHHSVRRRLPGGKQAEFSLGQYLDILQLPDDEVDRLPYLANMFLHAQFPELSPDVEQIAWVQPNWFMLEPFAALLRAGFGPLYNW